MSRAATHSWSAAELKCLVAAERGGEPFLIWRDASGGQRLFGLARRSQATIGRRSCNDVVLAGDREVSRTHAVLELVGGDWTIADDGLSRNGTFLRGVRITRRQRLTDGDLLRVGQTAIEYHRPGQGATPVTTASSPVPSVERIGQAQERILIALCRPLFTGAGPMPATNAEIAAEVFLGVDAVKKHLRALYARFGLARLPQNQKRVALATAAVERGFVSQRLPGGYEAST